MVTRTAALKVAHEPGYRDATTRQRYRTLFFNEMRAASILCHPNIVEVLDVGAEDHVYYIAMEYVEGGQTLESWCHADHLLPVEEALVLVARCARTRLRSSPWRHPPRCEARQYSLFLGRRGKTCGFQCRVADRPQY